MRAAPEDRLLSDDEWAGIADEVMHRTALSPYGEEEEAVRWIAVRHGDDHIHLVAMLARQDGGKPGLSWELYKVRAACIAAEQRYGLRSTAPADRTAARRPTRSENEKAARRGLDEAPRITLRRQVTTAAAAANSEDEFFARLDPAGVLMRKRFSVKNPRQITGYAVALQGDTAKGGGPVWYGGGKLASDLSWPKLRQRWIPERTTPGHPYLNLTAEERNAIWDHATRVAADATAQIRSLAWTSPAAADVAWATSDALHVAAAMLGSRTLRQAADVYDRAARAPHGRIPPPTPAGNQRSPKPSPNSATSSSTPPRPPPRCEPPSACTPRPARVPPYSRPLVPAWKRRRGSLRSPFRPCSNQVGTHRPSTAPGWPISGRRAGPSSHGHAAPPSYPAGTILIDSTRWHALTWQYPVNRLRGRMVASRLASVAAGLADCRLEVSPWAEP